MLQTRFGPQIEEDGTRFRLWAPAFPSMTLHVGEDAIPMDAGEDGWHEAFAPDAGHGARYAFAAPDGRRYPDPASRFQPEGVHGPSEVVDPATLAPKPWEGRPWAETVIYELHVGTFTPEGTFRAAIGKIDHLAGLGVTAVEIMPVGAFPGRWGWGYDIALPFATHAPYGRPEDLVALVDAAHERGLMVFMDVVYNHFGPEGAVLPQLAPPALTDRHHTVWGPSLNFDGEGSANVRSYVCENAEMWIRDFGMDGLRIDAADNIIDDGDEHVLTLLARRARKAGGGRPVHLVLENDAMEPHRLRPDGPFDAQWADDLHHCLHVAVTEESEGYYGAYTGRPHLLGRALAEGFAYQGETPKGREEPRGAPSGHLPPGAFVAFLQNHDQVGNRLLSERIHFDAEAEAVEAAMATVILSPQVPLLFMGEEWATRSPFPFFCDFEGDLAEAVREGRAEEFSHFPGFVQAREAGTLPVPTDPETFRDAVLDWDRIGEEPHAGRLALTRDLLRIRAERIVPLLGGMTAGGEWDEIGGWGLHVRWPAGDRTLHLLSNLSPDPCPGRTPEGEVIWERGAAGEELAPWTTIFSVA